MLDSRWMKEVLAQPSSSYVLTQSGHCGVRKKTQSPKEKKNIIKCDLTSHVAFGFTEIKITINGNTGHALNFVENTCVEKLHKVMDGFLKIREEEKIKWQNCGTNLDALLSHFTTVNITMINVCTYLT